MTLLYRCLVGFSVTATCGPALGQAAPRDQRPPNVVFLLADDLGWRDLGCMRSEYYLSPRIDGLAAEGMTFRQAYACAPNCAPSRACLMTGCYTPRHGVFTVGDPVRGRHRFRRIEPTPNRTDLDESFETLPELLQAAGYATAGFGKWHLGPRPENHGFDEFRQKSDFRFGAGFFRPQSIGDQPGDDEAEHLADALTDAAIDFMNRHADRPFFLYLPFHSVHTPIQAKARLIEKHQRRPRGELHFEPVYAAMIETLDDCVGRVIDELDRLNLADETLVVFYSDNGGYGPITDMSPLRGSKGMLYEGGVRVPLIVRWPGRARAGAICDAPVIGVDFLPTLVETCGAEAPVDQPVDGVSLAPLLAGGEIDRDALYWHFPAYLEGYSDTPGPFRTTPASAVRLGDWKLIEFFEEGRTELYDLSGDVGERRDLAAERPDLRDELLATLRAWREATAAPVPREPNPRFDADAVWSGPSR